MKGFSRSYFWRPDRFNSVSQILYFRTQPTAAIPIHFPKFYGRKVESRSLTLPTGPRGKAKYTRTNYSKVLKSLFKILVLFWTKCVGKILPRLTQKAFNTSLQLFTERVYVLCCCVMNTSTPSIGSYWNMKASPAKDEGLKPVKNTEQFYSIHFPFLKLYLM
jgi:hypothetical protein